MRLRAHGDSARKIGADGFMQGANISAQKAPTAEEDVFEELHGRCLGLRDALHLVPHGRREHDVLEARVADEERAVAVASAAPVQDRRVVPSVRALGGADVGEAQVAQGFAADAELVEGDGEEEDGDGEDGVFGWG